MNATKCTLIGALVAALTTTALGQSDTTDLGPREVLVDVDVGNLEGEPVATEVILRDRGGTPDNRKRNTGPDGQIEFVEGVGPPPCNFQTIELPEYGKVRSLGCNNGGVRKTADFEVSNTPPDNDLGSREIRVNVGVEGEDGEPVDTEVLLHDRGGTPDDREAETGEDGKVEFTEGVGPPPCNTQSVELPSFGRQKNLGCSNGGVDKSVEFRVGPTSRDTSASVTDSNQSLNEEIEQLERRVQGLQKQTELLTQVARRQQETISDLETREGGSAPPQRTEGNQQNPAQSENSFSLLDRLESSFTS